MRLALLISLLGVSACAALLGCKVPMLSDNPHKRGRSDTATTAPQLVAERGHSDAAQFGAFGRGGSVVVTVGSTEAIEWDVSTGRELRRFRGHSDIVRTVAIHGDRVVTGSSDGTIRFWDLATAEQVHLIRLRSASTDDSSRSVRAVSFLDNGRQIGVLDQDYGAFADRRQFFSKYDVKTYNRTARVRLPGTYIDFGTFSDDGRYLAIGYDDNKLIVYDTTNGSSIATFTPPNWKKDRPFTGRRIVISPRSTRLAALSESDGIIVYELATGQLLRTISTTDLGSVQATAFNHDDSVLLIAVTVDVRRDTTPRGTPFTSSSLEHLLSIDLNAESTPRSVEIGGEDVFFANGCCQHTGSANHGIGTHPEYTTVLPGGTTLFATTSSGDSYVVDIATGRTQATYRSNVVYVEGLAASSDLAWFATAVRSHISLWSKHSGQVGDRLGPLNVRSSRAGNIIEGPYLDVRFRPSSHGMTIADAGTFYDVDLDAKAVQQTSRVTPLGYVVARRADQSLALVDTGINRDLGSKVFGRELALAVGPKFSTSDQRITLKSDALPGQPMTAPVPGLFREDGSEVFFVHDHMPCSLETREPLKAKC